MKGYLLWKVNLCVGGDHPFLKLNVMLGRALCLRFRNEYSGLRGEYAEMAPIVKMRGEYAGVAPLVQVERRVC